MNCKTFMCNNYEEYLNFDAEHNIVEESFGVGLTLPKGTIEEFISLINAEKKESS